METLCWVLVDATPETAFISAIFHLLLAGLTFVVLLHQIKMARPRTGVSRDWFLPSAFLLLSLHFALQTALFAGFLFQLALPFSDIRRACHALFACGFLLIAGSYLKAHSDKQAYLARWILGGCAIVGGVLLLDIALTPIQIDSLGRDHSPAMLFADLIGLLALTMAIKAVVRASGQVPRSNLVALTCLGVAFFVPHVVQPFFPQVKGVFVWNAPGHLLSLALFAFAWSVGERSGNLLDRVFVRLNLAFIILASLLMVVIAGIERNHYLQSAEERSKNLAEFLREHIETHGNKPEEIIRDPGVLQRAVVELGNMPEVREIRVDLNGQRYSLHRAQDGTITEKIRSLPERAPSEPDLESPDTFQVIRLSLGDRSGGRNQLQFLGTTEYLNQHIGKYIAVIYASFTVIVVLASIIIGLIITDADRQLRQQQAEVAKSQQELAQAAKLASIGQLAAGLAHEINNPITSVLSLASYLTDENGAAALAPHHRKSLQLMAQQTERASKIVQNLLIFARKSHLQLSWVDVAEQLEGAISLVQHRLAQILLMREIEPNLPPILGDPGRLTEVFVNLLNNAIDAMPARGALVVRAGLIPQPQGGVRIEVSDNGCGIPPEQLPRIFDPFFTTKAPGRGTGLGLSISHGIVKDHRGQIWAENRPGGGTTFVVILPKEAVRDELTYTSA